MQEQSGGHTYVPEVLANMGVSPGKDVILSLYLVGFSPVHIVWNSMYSFICSESSNFSHSFGRQTPVTGTCIIFSYCVMQNCNYCCAFVLGFYRKAL